MSDHIKLRERIEHFEKHQLEAGDEYGAEVLHRANERIAQLEEYATHKPGCHESGNECICGLDALLTGEKDANTQR